MYLVYTCAVINLTVSLPYEYFRLSVPLDTEFCEGLDIPDTANTFVQGEIKTLSMDDWMKTSISDHSKIKMIKSITREC